MIQQPPPRPASTPTETQQSVLTSVQQEIAARRKANISRQDSRLSVKCLIESIENATKQAKAGEYNFRTVVIVNTSCFKITKKI